jgi:hypothetical protein
MKGLWVEFIIQKRIIDLSLLSIKALTGSARQYSEF